MSIMIDGIQYYGVIYKIENIITHKVYIGQTTHRRGFNGRYFYKGIGIERVYKDLKSKKDRGAHGNLYLLRSIETCGFDAFKVDEVLDVALTYEELNEKERYYIEKFDSYKNGYNMTPGGDNVPGSERPTGKDCKNSKAVCQIGLDGQLIKIWDCATDASRELGVGSSSISQVCSGYVAPNGRHKNTAGGFIWLYAKDYNPENVQKAVYKVGHPNKGEKAVLWLSDDGKDVIREFYSVCNAGDILGIPKQSVSEICLRKIKHPRYNLIFKSEYIEEQRLNEKDYIAEAV